MHKHIQKNDLTSSTKLGLNPELFSKIQKKSFCIVGCGGVGAYFAEMLVRTGATKIILIDGDGVELKNLNRTPFFEKDINLKKVVALKKHLKDINKRVCIKAISRHFGCYIENDKKRQEVRDLVVNSDITVIAVDKNRDRIECEELLKTFRKQYLVIGMEVKQSDKSAKYGCRWMDTTHKSEIDKEGYGDNGSYMSIVLEAVSVGFNMMMHCMNVNKTEPYYILQSYKNYQQTKT